MEAVVDQTLSNVHSAHAFFRLQFVAENDFVHGWSGVRQVVCALKALANVVGVQDRVFSGLPQTVRTIRLDVGQSPNEHSKVAIERADPPYRLRTVVFETESAIGLGYQDRGRQEGLEFFLDCDRPGTWAAATMGR